MKHLSIIIIVVSLCVFLLSIGVYHKVPWSVLPIVVVESVYYVGFCSIYSVSVKKEIY